MTDTERAAIMRGIYNALGMFAATFLTTLLASDDLRQALIIAGIAAFASLGFRAGVEGAYDAKRDRVGDVRPADVGYAAAADPMSRNPNDWPDPPMPAPIRRRNEGDGNTV